MSFYTTYVKKFIRCKSHVRIVKSFKHLHICIFVATNRSDHGQSKEYAIIYWTGLNTQREFLVKEDRSNFTNGMYVCMYVCIFVYIYSFDKGSGS